LQRGHLVSSAALVVGTTAAAPQRGQCLLPTKIMPKHEGQATVASREPQKRHSGSSVAVAAPQFGQLSVSACINRILTAAIKLDYRDCL